MDEEKLQEEIKELGTSRAGGIHCLTIVGQIEGHQTLGDDVKATKYEHVLPLLAAIEETEEIGGLLILLNTMGGDVEAGLAIAELIAGMKKPTCSLHPVRLNGVVIGVPQTYNYFARIQDRIVRFVTTHSRCPREEYLRLMTNTDELANDIGSVIYGAEAVENGLIDSLGTLSDALDYLHSEMAGKPD